MNKMKSLVKAQDKDQKGYNMSFEDIGIELGISTAEVKRIYSKAVRKLKVPSEENKTFWEYINISDNDTDSDMSGKTL